MSRHQQPHVAPAAAAARVLRQHHLRHLHGGGVRRGAAGARPREGGDGRGERGGGAHGRGHPGVRGGVDGCNIPKIHLKKLLEIISKFWFVVELPKSPGTLSIKSLSRHPNPVAVPTSESSRCHVSLFSLVPCITPDRRACASSRDHRRDFRHLSLSLFPFFPFFFSLSPFSFSSLLLLSPSSCFCPVPHARR